MGSETTRTTERLIELAGYLAHRSMRPGHVTIRVRAAVERLAWRIHDELRRRQGSPSG